jgi:hypothetical protein
MLRRSAAAAAAAGRRALAAPAAHRALHAVGARASQQHSAVAAAGGALPSAATRWRGAAPHGGACCCGCRGFAGNAKAEPEAGAAADGAKEDAAPGEEGAPSVEELLAQLAEREAQLEEHANQARALWPCGHARTRTDMRHTLALLRATFPWPPPPRAYCAASAACGAAARACVRRAPSRRAHRRTRRRTRAVAPRCAWTSVVAKNPRP